MVMESFQMAAKSQHTSELHDLHKTPHTAKLLYAVRNDSDLRDGDRQCLVCVGRRLGVTLS